MIDSRWSAFEGLHSHEDFLKHAVPEIYLKPEVNEDVRKSFDVIKKLLQYSYYEYEFFDVAAMKALLTFEMALKIRFLEKFNRSQAPKNLHLKFFIQWFLDRNYFETSNPKFLENIRYIRNHLAHPDRYSFGGGLMSQWIEHSVDLINSLYEDVDLRRKRSIYSTQLLKKVRDFINHQAVLHFNGKSELIFDGFPLFIDNKQKPSIIHFVFFPIENENNEPAFRKHIIVFACSKPVINNEKIYFNDIESNSDVSILKNLTSLEQSEIDGFKKKLTGSNLLYLPKLQAYLMSLEADKNRKYNQLLRNFNKK